MPSSGRSQPEPTRTENQLNMWYHKGEDEEDSEEDPGSDQDAESEQEDPHPDADAESQDDASQEEEEEEEERTAQNPVTRRQPATTLNLAVTPSPRTSSTCNSGKRP